ncbi:hypothetical protein GDO81_010635 [Engystomops pustulosus]|uniref:Secreted protein n=1 Tax=Engystomops pustulosus TaxID=76066 RepID=A0AAV7C2Z6_ENGPU|nr:hypothetical protein GDO81_010635 [Engystomops pustulosus]
MKIAIVFLILGLSSGLADADQGISGYEYPSECTGHLTLCNAETLAFLVLKIIGKFEEIKAYPPSPEKTFAITCLMQEVIDIMCLVADLTGCPYSQIVDLVMSCLKVDEYNKNLFFYMLKNKDPRGAVNFDATGAALREAVCCAVAKIMARYGIDFLGLLTNLVPRLALTLGPLLTVVLGVVGGLVTALSGTLAGILAGVGGVVGGLGSLLSGLGSG